MFLVALSSWGDHAVHIPILTGWLTHLLVFCDEFRGCFCSQRRPHILLFSWGGICCEYLQVWKSLLVIFVWPTLVSRFHRVWCARFFCNSQNPLFLSIGSVQICRVCNFYFQTWLIVTVPISVFILFYFLLYPVTFIFLLTPCRFPPLFLFGLFWSVGTWILLRRPWFCFYFIFSI